MGVVEVSRMLAREESVPGVYNASSPVIGRSTSHDFAHMRIRHHILTVIYDCGNERSKSPFPEHCEVEGK